MRRVDSRSLIAHTLCCAALGAALLPAYAMRAGGAQAPKLPGGASAAADLLASPPRAWVVQAAENEIKAISHTGSYLRYRLHTVDHRGDRIRDTIETKDGTVARLLERDGRPLTPDEDKDERDRLTAMLDEPSEYAKHIKDDVEGKKLATDLIKLLPDAMDFTYVPGQPQTANAPGREVVIDYAPKPGWNPPTTISEGLRGLRGRVWIDARSRYVVRMEGEVFQGVNFGWGMLAHIYPGGKLLLEQRGLTRDNGVHEERWIFTSFSDDLKLRAVMLKTISVQTKVESSNYQALPGPLTYQEAIRMLLATPSPVQ